VYLNTEEITFLWDSKAKLMEKGFPSFEEGEFKVLGR